SPTPRITRAPLRYEVLWRDFYNTHEHLDADGRRQHLERTLRRATWLVLSEGHREEFTTSPELRPVEAEFYRALDEGRGEFKRVRDFKAYPRLGPLVFRDDHAEVLFRVFDHPRIEIWKRKDAQ
ncbi:MAG: hypothetical protein HKN12_03840, partial [Gemmatimonadetes bacterium]|nr:hypothetical protein [Gemmatimonadota bacterium]